MPADALDPQVARVSAGMVLTVYDRQHVELLHCESGLLLLNKILDMIPKVNTCTSFIISKQFSILSVNWARPWADISMTVKSDVILFPQREGCSIFMSYIKQNFVSSLVCVDVIWCHQTIIYTINEVLWHPSAKKFTENIQDSNHWNESEKYTFEIMTSSTDQWVKDMKNNLRD